MLIGSITNQGSLSGQITNANGYLTGFITNAGMLGGQVIAERGLKGDKGDKGDQGNTGATGADGFSPSASVSKVGDTSTITITDKDGTTTADVYDGEVNVNDYGKLRIFNHGQLLTETARSTQDTLRFSAGENIQLALSNPDAPVIEISSDGGASAFIAEYGVTSYADVKDAYDEDAIILCVKDNNGNPLSIMHLTHYNTALHFFVFAVPLDSGWANAILHQDSTWAYSTHDFASTDTATTSADGLMASSDKSKLNGIASGAEVNVQSDWDEADSTDDAYIKNKPTIPNVFTSTLEPTSADGEDGDVWFIYYPLFTVDDGTDTYDYQFELGSSWATFVSSSFNNNKFSVDAETDEVLWVATGTRIYTDTTTPVYILKTDLVGTGETYYVEAVPVSEPEEPESGE